MTPLLMAMTNQVGRRLQVPQRSPSSALLPLFWRRCPLLTQAQLVLTSNYWRTSHTKKTKPKPRTSPPRAPSRELRARSRGPAAVLAAPPGAGGGVQLGQANEPGTGGPGGRGGEGGQGGGGSPFQQHPGFGILGMNLGKPTSGSFHFSLPAEPARPKQKPPISFHTPNRAPPNSNRG